MNSIERMGLFEADSAGMIYKSFTVLYFGLSSGVETIQFQSL